jgi:predicted dehydrogenase
MKSKSKLKRRQFIKAAAATTATITIVPSHVIAGTGHVPPSDKINIANIGCGTQGLREMGSLLTNEKIQLVTVCDVNKYTTNYIDWSPHGIRNGIRKVLGDESWWEGIKGIPGGRDVGKEYAEKYYAKNTPSGKYSGVSSYEDFRDLFDQENDLDAIKIMTPDHLHAPIAMAAMEKGIDVLTHKPIANRMEEGRLTIDKARETGVVTHLLAWSERPEYDLILSWIKDGVIGELKEIHNWSYRPVWQQWTKRPQDTPPIPDGFNWDLWLGPVPDMPYHQNYTNNVFRGWYDFGGGSIADMGHYSLFPLFEAFGINKSPTSARAFGTTTREAVDNVYKWVENDVAFPQSCLIRLKFPKQESLPSFDLCWYDGGMKPFPPEELAQDHRDIPNEGMMFVGDKGKILAGFRGEKPEIIPQSKMDSYSNPKRIDEENIDRYREKTWVQAILDNQQSPGSFIRAETVTETINLAAVALRAGKQVEYDSKSMKITNDEEANKYLTRAYRPGWELS